VNWFSYVILIVAIGFFGTQCINGFIVCISK